MIVLDTNVVSEILRPEPELKVRTWLDDQNKGDVFLSVISIAELRYGALIMPQGERRKSFIMALDRILRQDFRFNKLSFDDSAAEAYGSIAADRHRIGRPTKQMDGQIAAICYTQGAAVATRNVKDFEECGIDIINPWDYSG